MYIITALRTSDDCGTFTNNYTFPHEVMTENEFFSDLFLFRPFVAFGINVILVIVWYFGYSLGKARANLVDILRTRIKEEKKDKKFLLEMLDLINDDKASSNSSTTAS